MAELEDGNVAQYQVVNQLPPIPGAEVFLARSRDSGCEVVLRVLRRELATVAPVVRRFVETVAACRSVQHPQLAKILDSGTTPEGRPWVATESFGDDTLAKHLRTNSGLSPAELIRLAVPMCEALEAAHRAGVLHGGLKPSSIFLGRGLGVEASRLLDLGLSQFEGDASLEADRTELLAQLTYSNPESLSGAQVDARSDLYSFGVVLYEALTGSPPFLSANPDELRRMHLQLQPAQLTGSHSPLAAVVQRCMAKNPRDRFTSAAELAKALSQCQLPATLDPHDVRALESGTQPAEYEEAREKPGDLLGSYQLVRLIGEGAMGRVYLAQHTKLGRQVALKVLRTSQTRSRALVQRFFQEARTVNQINHEHIVEVFDFVEELTPDGINLVYCVMELLAGASLSQTLAEEHLSIERVVGIAGQVCAALDAAHRVGVVHRDIKPDNIFLTTRAGISDFAKVLDFGVAKITQPIGQLKVSDTLSGSVVGTPTYMSPEQAAGLEVDARSDIYGLGTVLYEMVTGRVPFDATSFGQLAAEIITRKPPPLGELSIAGDRIPSALKTLIFQALEKEPAGRPATMGEFGAALAAITTDSARVVRSRKAVGLIAGGLIAAGLAVVIWRATAAPSPAPLAPPRELVAAPTSPALPATVKLNVGSTPLGASVTRLDTGETLGVTPLAKVVSRLDRDLALSLKLDGYQVAQRVVRLDENTQLDVSLDKEKPAPLPAARPRPKKKVGKESTIDPFSE